MPIGEIAGDRRIRTAAAIVALIAVAVGAFLLLDAASLRVVAANSDGATVVLEGQSMAHGGLLLSGWSLPLDSFFSTEVPFYAVAVALVGVRADLVNVVPAVIAAAVIAAGVVIAIRAGRGASRYVGAAIVVGLLALPSPALAFFLAQGPWHVGTALACLVAFCGASSPRWGWRSAIAIVALTAGLLGDVQTLAFGVAPVLAGGLVAACRARSIRCAALPSAIAALSVVLAYSARQLFRVIGTFTLVGANPTARLAQVGANVRHLPGRFAGMWGVGAVPIGPTTRPSVIAPLHVVVLAAAVAGVAVALVQLLRGVALGDRRLVVPAGSRSLDDLLVLAFFADLATFVLLAATGNGDYARYLTPGVIFATVLLARQVTRTVSSRSSATGRAIVCGTLAIVAGLAIGFVVDLAKPPVARPAGALAAFLAAHGLTSGVGDYWSASIVTTTSNGKVAVRPVIATPGGTLARYGRESDAAWYAGQRFTFLVYDLHHPWRSVNATSAAATFGPPRQILEEGTYRIFVFGRPVAVSPVGYSNS